MHEHAESASAEVATEPIGPDAAVPATAALGGGGAGGAPLAARMLALQAAAGNRAVAALVGGTPQARRLQREPTPPAVELRQDGGIVEVIVGGRPVARCTGGQVELDDAWVAASSTLVVTVVLPRGGEAELIGGYRESMTRAARRWRLRIVRHATRGELLEPAWDVVANESGGGAAAAPLPKLEPSKKPETAPDPRKRPTTYPDQRVQALVDELEMAGQRVGELAAELSEDDFRVLTTHDRLALIRALADKTRVGDREEQALTRALKATPAYQAQEVGEALKAGGGALLRKLDSAIDGENQEGYYAAITPLLTSLNLGESLYGQYENAYRLEWSGPDEVRPDRQFGDPEKAITITYKAEWTGDGQLHFSWVRAWLIAPKVEGEVTLAPEAIVAVYFRVDDPEAGGVAGQTIYMPAVAFLALVHRQFRRNMWQAVQTAAMVGGVASAAGAVTWLARIVTVVEAALATAAWIVEQYRSTLLKTEGGRAFLKRWDIVQSLVAVYGMARLVLAMPKALKALAESYRSVRSALTGTGVAVEKIGDFERRMGELNLRLADAEREAQAASKAAVEPVPESAPAPATEPATEPETPRVRVAEEPGQWAADFEGGTNMSEGAAAYEVQTTGKAASGSGYYVGGVQFDGYKGGVLIDSKFYVPGARMERLLREQNIFVGIKLVEQAQRQLRAAAGTPIEWVVASEEATEVIRALFRRNQIPINVRFEAAAEAGAAATGVRIAPGVGEEAAPLSDPAPSTQRPEQQRMRLPTPR